MADQFLDTVRDALEGSIDFEGQRLAEQVTTNLLAILGLLSFLVGYLTQNIHYVLWIGLGGTALTFLAVVPPWPFYNQHPVTWLPAKKGLQGISLSVDGKRIS